jgi:hypothetical protein
MIADTHIKLNSLSRPERIGICNYRYIDNNKNKEWLSDRA